MSGDNFIVKSQKTRPVLGDVTNLSGKRGCSSISDDLGRKSGDGYVKNIENESEDSTFRKKVCLQVENLMKKICKSKSEVDSNEKNASLFKDKRENFVSVGSNALDKINEMPDLGITIAQPVVEHGVEASRRENYLSSVSLPACSKKGCDGERTENDIVEEELLVGRACNDKDVGSRRLALSKCGSVEWSRLPNSQDTRSFELERCSGLKVDDADMLKDCSCSFCLKAAYIWTDLHYQDIKGRIAALKRSQKDATFLVQKYSRGKETDIPGRGNSNNLSKLESDLMNQWKSLFLQMEDIFGHESSQLQASFDTLKDLRENCKMDLERTDGMPSDKY